MNSRRKLEKNLTSSALSSATQSSAINVKDRRYVVLVVTTTGTVDLTWKVQAGYGNEQPNFGAAASQSNQWEHVQFVGLSDRVNDIYDGTNGLATTTAETRAYIVDCEAADWISIDVSTHTSGSLTATAHAYTNA